MKRIFLILLSFLLLLSLCSCKEQAADTVLDVIGKEDDDAKPSDSDAENLDADGNGSEPSEPDIQDPIVEIPVKEPDSDDMPSGTEDKQDPPQPDAPVQIDAQLPYTTDLNGDGVDEQIELELMDFGAFSGRYRLCVNSESMKLQEDTYIRASASVWLADLDGDGEKEIFLSGDFASDDFITYGFRLRDGQLQPIRFADTGLWTEQDASRVYTYGKICQIHTDGLELEETFDLLGSYCGRIRFVPEGDVYILETEKIEFAGNQSVLKTKVELPVTYQNGDVEADGTLNAGKELTITGMDLAGDLYFQTVDGGKGYITLTSTDGGLTHQIGGLDEFDCFESLPYAG